MNAAWSDDKRAVAANIYSWENPHAASDKVSWIFQVPVCPATACPHARTIRKRPVFMLDFAQRFKPSVPWINIDYHTAIFFPGRNADVGSWIFLPPCLDRKFIFACVV